jgi:glutamate synthase domain-containing protein 1
MGDRPIEFCFVVINIRDCDVFKVDRIACKPAVLAETDDYVAFASEYRAFADLPGILAARVWEPEPATVYFWEHTR